MKTSPKYSGVMKALLNRDLFPDGVEVGARGAVNLMVQKNIIPGEESMCLYTSMSKFFTKAGFTKVGLGSATKWVRRAVLKPEATTNATFGKRVARLEQMVEAICREWKIEVPS